MARDTKTELLDLAENITRSRGFDGFSYADLADAIGIRKASIHYHFPTKAALSEALIDRYHAKFEKLCGEIEVRHEAAASQLLALIAVYREACLEGTALCLCVSLTASKESLSDAVKAKIRGFRTMMLAWLTGVFERGQADQSIRSIEKPDHEARSTLAMLEGAHIAARAEEDVTIYDQAVQKLMDRCLGR